MTLQGGCVTQAACNDNGFHCAVGPCPHLRVRVEAGSSAF